MGVNYLPSRDGQLVTWSTNFAQVVAADPTAVGLTLQQSDDYTAAQAAYAAGYQTANDPLTRSPSNIEAKNAAKETLVDMTRGLVRIIQAFPGTTDNMRVNLGITVPDDTRTPVPPPSESPVIDIVSVSGTRINIRLHNGESTSRAKPEGVIGANVFTYVGDAAPTDIDSWTFAGATSKVETAVDLPADTAPGSKVWITAFWFNGKAESGPATPPISTNIPGGGLSQAA